MVDPISIRHSDSTLRGALTTLKRIIPIELLKATGNDLSYLGTLSIILCAHGDVKVLYITVISPLF